MENYIVAGQKLWGGHLVYDTRFPVLSEDAHRHQLVADELMRRPSTG